ncbi:hypothetical protein ACWCPG_33040, partial [Streptomyces sp. NPDC001919]
PEDADDADTEVWDVVVVGAGPGGSSGTASVRPSGAAPPGAVFSGPAFSACSLLTMSFCS